jgi:hypothetical protein
VNGDSVSQKTCSKQLTRKPLGEDSQQQLDPSQPASVACAPAHTGDTSTSTSNGGGTGTSASTNTSTSSSASTTPTPPAPAATATAATAATSSAHQPPPASAAARRQEARRQAPRSAPRCSAEALVLAEADVCAQLLLPVVLGQTEVDGIDARRLPKCARQGDANDVRKVPDAVAAKLLLRARTHAERTLNSQRRTAQEVQLAPGVRDADTAHIVVRITTPHAYLVLGANEEVVWLYVSVQEVLGMDVLHPRYQHFAKLLHDGWT